MLPNTTDPCLSTTEVAAQLGVHPHTVRAMVMRGELKATLVGPRKIIRVHPDDLRAYARGEGPAASQQSQLALPLEP